VAVQGFEPQTLQICVRAQGPGKMGISKRNLIYYQYYEAFILSEILEKHAFGVLPVSFCRKDCVKGNDRSKDVGVIQRDQDEVFSIELMSQWMKHGMV
jgi:hypothetical protein